MRLVAIFCIVFLLVGCAIETTPRGYLDFKVDEVELFGTDVGKFKLQDGSEGTLRVLNGKYSVKLQKHLRVLPIKDATSARISSSQLIEGRMVVVIEISERNCSEKIHLMSIKDSEVLSWTLGDCKQQPKVSFSKDEAVFDYVYGKITARFIYANGRLLKSKLPTQTAAAYGASTITPSDRPRYLPSPPGNVSITSTPPSNDESPSVSEQLGEPHLAGATAPVSNASKSTKLVTTPAPARNLTFPSQEQKPVRIILDR